MQPLIGITSHMKLVVDADVEVLHHIANRAYVRAVRKAGGIPVLLPVCEPQDASVLLSRVAGLLVTGGDDVDPATYGAETDPRTVRTDPERDTHDAALCREAVERDLPTLAICRGSQILNVSLGGTLVQHVDDHFDIQRYNDTVHDVKIEGESALADWIGDAAIGVNTLHHQSVAAPGDGTRVVAYAPDGTIEGIEVSPRIVGVQWHPELLRHRPEHLALFDTLVRLAAD